MSSALCNAIVVVPRVLVLEHEHFFVCLLHCIASDCDYGGVIMRMVMIVIMLIMVMMLMLILVMMLMLIMVMMLMVIGPKSNLKPQRMRRS